MPTLQVAEPSVDAEIGHQELDPHSAMVQVVNQQQSSETPILQKADSTVNISICPETFYGCAIALFVASVILCTIITFGFTKPDMDEDPIVKVFGSVNVCIVFDYNPARSVFAVAWAFTTILQAGYVILFTYRLHLFFPPNAAVRWTCKYIGVLYLICWACLLLSALHGPADEIVMHTLGFEVMIGGHMLWWIYNTWVIEVWPNQLNSKVRWYWRIATVIYLSVCILKIYMHWVILHVHLGNLSKEEGDKYSVPMKSLIDPLWMLGSLFFHFWNPLSGKAIIVTFSKDPTNRKGAANICCKTVLSEDDVRDGKEKQELLRASDIA